MRLVGLIGLVIALAIVGLLVKKQMGGIAGAPAAADPRAQSQQIQKQIQQSLDAATKARPLPDDGN